MQTILKQYANTVSITISSCQVIMFVRVWRMRTILLKSPCQRGLRLSNSQCKTARIRTSPRPRIKSSTNDFMLERFILPVGITNQRELICSLLWFCTMALHHISRRKRSDRSYRCLPTHPAPKVSLQIWAGFRLKRRSVLIPRVVASHHWPFDQAHKPNTRTCGSSRTKQDYHCNDSSSVG